MTNVDAARAVYSLFERPGADPEAAIAALHDDVVFECPFYDGMAPRIGKGVVATMIRSMDQGPESYFSQQRFPFHELHTTGDPDRFIIEAQGDHVIRSTGRSYRNHYFHCLTIADGKVVRWTEYSNPNEHARASQA